MSGGARRLFDDDWFMLNFSAEEMAVLGKSIVGDGGHQRLLRRLYCDNMKGDTMEISGDDLQQVNRYIEDYGGGGYQDRFKVIRSAAWRAGWQQKERASDV